MFGPMEKEVIGNGKNCVELSSPELTRYYSVDEMGDTWGACGGEVKCAEECGGMC